MGSESRKIELAYDKQKENQEQQQGWQSSENSVDRAWQESEWTRQFQEQVRAQQEQSSRQIQEEAQANWQNWLKQFQAENEYNSPQAQVRRMMAAGINPAAAFSALTSGNSSGVSVAGVSGSASAPSGGAVGSHHVSPLGFSMPAYSTDASLFSSAAQLQDSLSKIQGVTLAENRQKAMLGAEVSNLMADSEQKRSQTLMNNINASLRGAFGSREAESVIQKNISDSYAAYARGDLDKAQELYTNTMDKLGTQQYSINEANQPVVYSNLQKYGKLLESQREAQLASAENSRAQANFANQLATTESALRDGKVTAQQFSNDLLFIQKQLQGRENVRDAATHQDKISAIVSECARQQLINTSTEQQIRKAMTDNDWNTVEHFFGVLGSAASSVGSVGNVMVGSQRNQIQREFNSVWSDYLERTRQMPIESGQRYRLDDNGLLWKRP